ncbi:hypothetical protein [Streptomyces sp. NRRL S-495]|uniref:hypothetical protein n=1 Tax=Streptomyces sp. NRRL S-495 TaxID=1609133 RepID=UPI002570D3C4|nr:hypothetical protein [Streptomyces sp. NRRL S-495]
MTARDGQGRSAASSWSRRGVLAGLVGAPVLLLAACNDTKSADNGAGTGTTGAGGTGGSGGTGSGGGHPTASPPVPAADSRRRAPPAPRRPPSP